MGEGVVVASAGGHSFNADNPSVHGQSSLNPAHPTVDSALVESIFRTHVLPLYETLLSEPEPLPTLLLTLLSIVLRRCAALSRTVADCALVHTLVRRLQPDPSDELEEASEQVLETPRSPSVPRAAAQPVPDSESIILVIRHLVCSGHVNVLLLCDDGLPARVGRSLQAAVDAGGEVRERCVALLEILHTVLHAAAHAMREALTGRRQLLATIRSISPLVDTLQQSPQDGPDALQQSTAPLLFSVNTLTALLCADDDDIPVWAGRCLVLLFQLHPGEYYQLAPETVLSDVASALESRAPIVRKLLLKLLQRAITHYAPLARTVGQHARLAATLQVLAAGLATGVAVNESVTLDESLLNLSWGSAGSSGSMRSTDARASNTLASLAASLLAACRLA